MKLFRKKNKASEQSDAEIKTNSKSTQSHKNKNKQKAAKTRTLHSWIIQPILVSAICFVLCYFLIELLYFKPLDVNYQSQISATQAKALEIDVSSYFKEQAQWVDGLSKYASISRRQVNNNLSDIKPELKEVHLLSIGELNQPLVQEEGFSFASLDLLRRVAKGEKTDIEAFLQEGEWYFQIAAATAVENEGVIEKGLQLAVFKLSGLTARLQRYQREFDASVAVLVEGINQPILRLGNDQSNNAIILPTALPGISVKFVPSETSFQPADRTLVWIVFVSVLVLLTLMLAIIFRVNMNSVKNDLQRAAQMVSKAIDSDSTFNNHFHFGEVYAMANAIVSNARQVVSKYKSQAAKAAKPKSLSSPMASVEDEPLFEDDLFDIDAIDSSEESDDLFGETGAIVEEQVSLNVEVSQAIFRAYDIRGIVDESLNSAIVELLGKAIASEAQAQGQATLCVGYDGRLSSAAYAESLVTGILSTGVNVIIIGQVPTPVLYFATHHFETGSGVMITGSHNPSNYNGLKTMIAGTTLSGEAVQKLYNRILMQDFAVGQGERSEQSIDREYLDLILNDIAVAAPLKVVLDAGNGVAGGIAPELIEELGCEVIPLYCDIDGNFPNHHPDPGQPENLQDLIAAVKEHNADIGLAFDGDGDRIGVVTNTGKIIWPDRLLMLFAKDVVSRNPGADIIYDVKCSRRLNSLISSYGGRPVMWKSGHSLIKSKMQETGALLAGEMSGHIFFKERWFGFDDGLYSAARLLEILGVEDKTSDEVFSEFPEDVSTPEITVAVDDEAKFSIIDKLCVRKEQFTGGNVSTIDGLRIDYPNGWGLCRASNTMPALVLRFEADDDAALVEIKSKFIMHLKDIEPSLDLKF
tara:strand:- start:8805 stop:11402 length:2598 start_codon:yes stop_codon:yes gene_type:complete